MENSDDGFVIGDGDKLNLSKGERYLFKYILYLCRKYSVDTVVNTQEFREKYLKVLSKNRIYQEDGTVSKYFETLKDKGFIELEGDFKRKYYRVKIEFIVNEKQF